MDIIKYIFCILVFIGIILFTHSVTPCPHHMDTNKAWYLISPPGSH